MISNVKLGAGLVAAIACIAVVVYTFSRPPAGDTARVQEPQKSQTAPNAQGTGPVGPTAPLSAQNAAGSLPASIGPSGAAASSAAGQALVPASGTLSPAQTKTQRAEQKMARAKALDVLSKVVSQGAAADPKEVNAALISLEATIPSAEGRKQLAMSRLVYERSLRIQALAVELGTVAKTASPQNNQRQQEIITEISTLQVEIKNVTDSARQYTAEQLKAAR